MAFTPEDGTGLVNANSLCPLAFADAYFAERNVVAWTGANSVKEAALIRATDYIEGRWVGKFKGDEQFPDNPQALSFPRLEIGWDSEVPTGILKATAEYALRALTGTPLAPDPTTDASGLALAGVREKVGPIETEVRYQAGMTSPALFKPYPAADMLVRPYLVASGGRLVRA